jgi:hypothetical protein
VKFITVLFFVLPAVPCFSQSTLGLAQPAPANWTGQYAPCQHHDDLLGSGHLEVAVKISTANPTLADQFENALDFWGGVLDLDWHEVDAPNECSMQLVDGTPSLFNFCTCMSARSQLPDRDDFQGLIAFNPRFKLSKEEMFIDSVHEIGHVFGLAHNPDDSSVMFSFGLQKPAWLDLSDLGALASRHALRPGILGRLGKSNVLVRLPEHLANRRLP